MPGSIAGMMAPRGSRVRLPCAARTPARARATDGNTNDRLRLHHRRRRLGRMRARQPAVRGPGEARPAAGGRRQGREPLDLDTGRLREADEQSKLQLVFRDRARGERQRAANPRPARPHSRRIERDQRHALRPRPAPRLRHLVPARQPGLVVRIGPALLPQVRALRAVRPGGNRRCALDRRPARRHRPVRAARDGRRLHRGGGRLRLPAQPRLQRRQSGRGRLLPVHDARRAPVQHRARLPSSGSSPPESPCSDPRPRKAGALRRQARGRSCLRRPWRCARGAGRRGHSVGGRRAVPATARALGGGRAGAP